MFEGFSDRTVDFMWGIRFNNEKSWFEAHKEDYLRDLYRPMAALNREVWERLSAAAPDLTLVGKVSRIYRDARRLHGRGPYKDHLWWSIQRPAEEEFSRRPVFWFELEPEGWSYGMGYYQAPPATMAKLRRRLDTRPAPFEKLARQLKKEGRFTLETEPYKRMGYYQAPPATMAKLRRRLDTRPAPFEKLARQLKKEGRFTLETEPYKRPKGSLSPLLDPWYNARSFVLHREHQGHQPILYSHDLADLVGEDLERLLPVYRYILSVEADPDPRN